MATAEKTKEKSAAAKFLSAAQSSTGGTQPPREWFCNWIHKFFRQGNLGFDIAYNQLSEAEVRKALREIWEKSGKIT
jgi:hypothetical protein